MNLSERTNKYAALHIHTTENWLVNLHSSFLILNYSSLVSVLVEDEVWTFCDIIVFLHMLW